MVPSLFVRSSFGRISVNPKYDFEQCVRERNIRDGIMTREQIRVVPLRWIVTDAFIDAIPPAPPNDSRAVVVAVHQAEVTQQVIGFHLNGTFTSLQSLRSFGMAIIRGVNPAVLGTNDGEGTSIYEEVHDGTMEPLIINARDEYGAGIDGPMGAYLEVNEKLYVVMFYEINGVPGLLSSCTLRGGVSFKFQPTERQRQQ